MMNQSKETWNNTCMFPCPKDFPAIYHWIGNVLAQVRLATSKTKHDITNMWVASQIAEQLNT